MLNGSRKDTASFQNTRRALFLADRMKFLKNFNLPLAAIVFAAAIIAIAVFTMSRAKGKDDEISVATKRLEKKTLPDSVLQQITEEKFFIVYLTSGCGACSDELPLLSELSANSPGIKIFGIMSEDESVVKKYVSDNNIKFPVILDRNLDMLRNLKIEFFPTNLTIENGIIKRAYIGAPENKEKLSALISD
jgi:thiol-disulfide isomerase/thioredoxin